MTAPTHPTDPSASDHTVNGQHIATSAVADALEESCGPQEPKPSVEQLALKALRLRAGTALQTKRLVAGAVKREGQFLAAMESRGVMIGPHGADGESTELSPGEICVVRGFTGQYEFSFVSKVLSVFEKPFPYALLAYPKHVDATLVRRSQRTTASWPTQAWPADARSSRATAGLIDISLSGAMIRTDANIAAVGEVMHISLAIEFEGTPIELTLKGMVCHTHKVNPEEFHHTGLAFKDLRQHDKLVLHFITQTAGA